jgi:hypothetical protein
MGPVEGLVGQLGGHPILLKGNLECDQLSAPRNCIPPVGPQGPRRKDPSPGPQANGRFWCLGVSSATGKLAACVVFRLVSFLPGPGSSCDLRPVHKPRVAIGAWLLCGFHFLTRRGVIPEPTQLNRGHSSRSSWSLAFRVVESNGQGLQQTIGGEPSHAVLAVRFWETLKRALVS